jgi:predicted permease
LAGALEGAIVFGEWVTPTWLRVKALVKRRRLDRDLEEEMRFHLAMREEKNRTAGIAPEEAPAVARRRFGNVTLLKEACREMWTFNSLETLCQDTRYGLRMLVKNPSFTGIAVLTLALGIGANTVIFSVVNGVMYRKPPVADPDRLMVVSSTSPIASDDSQRYPVSVPDYLDWRAQSSSFSSMAAGESDSFTISGGTTPERMSGAWVSPDFFNVLGVAPVLGRTLRPGEDQPGHDQVVILSDELWKGEFGSDPLVLGRTVKLNGNRYTVVGVMPPGFRLPSFLARLWVPLTLSHDNLSESSRGMRFLRIFARLNPKADVRHAQSEMEAIAQRIAQAHPDTNRGWGANVMSMQNYSIADANAGPPLAFLMAAVGFVLLIACANIANLLVARNSARQREFAIRGVLGAGRIRLARQLLTECVMLSFAGGVLGILFGYAGMRAVLSRFDWNEDAVAMAKEITIDGHVMAFTLVLVLVAAILFGLAPALQFSRGDASGRIKEGGRGSTAGRKSNRVQRVLVAGQLALSLFLLAGATIFAGGFIEEMRAGTGFNEHNLLTASVSLRGVEYLQPQRQKAFFENVVRRLSASPGVESAAAASDLPFNFPGEIPFTVENHAAEKSKQQPTCGYFAVSAGYFAATQIPLLQGREFTAPDNADAAPVAIVNEAFARRYFPGENPIGRHIRIGSSRRADTKWSEIIGIAGDVKEFVGQAEPRSEIFEPFLAHPTGSMNLVVRTRANPSLFADDLRGTVWAEDGNQAVTDVRTMERVIKDSAGGDDLMAELMGVFAAIALLMAAIGIYGVLSYLVSQRTHELGIRMALGANPSEVLGLVIRNGMALVGTGAAIGFVVSLALPKLILATINGFQFHGVWIIGIAPVLVITVGFMACYVPARRAMRVDPMVALRHE